MQHEYFIHHDLNVVDYMADRVIVIHQGNIIESGRVQEVLEQHNTRIHNYS